MEAVVIIPAKEWEEVKQGISSLAKIIKGLSVKDPLFTSQEVQEYLKKGSTWVDAHKHDIGCSKVGGEWRFRKSTVDQYVQSTYHKKQLTP